MWGRNYQDMPLLKKFVDVMAQYKMNVFHFHLTDNPGYRVECRVHPELNAPASYLPTRDPGKFYTYAEINDFIAYCKQRGVMVVPEIDIPGHSDYFKRAFGVEMQDEKGMGILEDVLNEFMDHVDTVLASGRMRCVCAIRSSWTILPTWSASAGARFWRGAPAIPFGAHRHADVVVRPRPRFPARHARGGFAQRLPQPRGPIQRAGAHPESCDRRPARRRRHCLGRHPLPLARYQCRYTDEHLSTKPGLPALLAASENYWHGHMPQHPEYWARLPLPTDPEYARFAEFEARLLEHRDRFFADWPFPYVRQTNIPWKLIGIFDHKGDVNAVLPPEREIRASYAVDGKTYEWTDAVGATIAVNHWQYDGWLPKMRQGTAYALTYVWAPRAETVGFWIGFNGPSRSSRRNQPNPNRGEWSTAGSKVWIDDREVPPPVWKQPGTVANSSEAPFVDEDYFYRPPTRVALRPGWNKILIKAPKGERTWNWTFTVRPGAGGRRSGSRGGRTAVFHKSPGEMTCLATNCLHSSTH